MARRFYRGSRPAGPVLPRCCAGGARRGERSGGGAGETVGRGHVTDAAGVKSELSGLDPGKAKGFKVVHSEGEMQSLFDRLSAGGKPVEGASFPGRVVELPDGTTLKFRSFSKSGGSTIEVYYPGRAGPVKVHIE